MAQPEFTPGPWSLEVDSRNWEGSDLLVTTANGEWNIAECRPNRNLGPRSEEVAQANARLISAAPDLYAVLKELSDLCPRMNEDDPIGPAIHDAIMRGRAALAKAEGRDGP